MVFLEILMCSLRVRPLHDYGRLISAQTVAKFGVFVVASFFGQIKCDRSTTTVVFFYVVFTNHDEGWCPLIVCDIT